MAATKTAKRATREDRANAIEGTAVPVESGAKKAPAVAKKKAPSPVILLALGALAGYFVSKR